MNTMATGEITAERPSRATTIPWYRSHGTAVIVAGLAALAFLHWRPASDARMRAYAAMNRPGVTLSVIGGGLDSATFQLAPGVESEKSNLAWAFHQLRQFPELKHIQTQFFLPVNLSALRSLTQLESFLVTGSAEIEDDDLAVFRELPKLDSLVLRAEKITSRGLRHLEGHPSLKTLVLHGPRLYGEGFSSLGRIPNLESLTIEGGRGKWGEPLSLSGATKLKALRLFNLGATPDELGDFKGLPALEDLELWNVNVDRNFFLRLQALPRLKSLKIRGAGFSLDGLTDAIVLLPSLESLFVADYSGKGQDQLLTAEGVKKLAGVKRLREIGVFGAPIGDEGVKALAAIPTLEQLTLNQTGMTERSFPALLAMKSLKTLNLFEPMWGVRAGINQGAMMRLREQLERSKKVEVRFDRGPPGFW